jgi:hypothetical protein
MKKNNYAYKEASNGLEAVHAFLGALHPFNVVLMGQYLTQRGSIADPNLTSLPLC